MRTTLLNFLLMRVQNATVLVSICLGLAWLVLLGSGLVSVGSQSRSFLWKAAWSVVLILLPFLGMLIYCCYCIGSADFAFLRQFGVRKRARQLQMQRLTTSQSREAA